METGHALNQLWGSEWETILNIIPQGHKEVDGIPATYTLQKYAETLQDVGNTVSFDGVKDLAKNFNWDVDRQYNILYAMILADYAGDTRGSIVTNTMLDAIRSTYGIEKSKADEPRKESSKKGSQKPNHPAKKNQPRRQKREQETRPDFTFDPPAEPKREEPQPHKAEDKKAPEPAPAREEPRTEPRRDREEERKRSMDKIMDEMFSDAAAENANNAEPRQEPRREPKSNKNRERKNSFEDMFNGIPSSSGGPSVKGQSTKDVLAGW